MAWHNNMKKTLTEIKKFKNIESPEEIFTPWKDVDIVFQLVGYDRDYSAEFMEYSLDYEAACDNE
jgi:hypothetical protein